MKKKTLYIIAHTVEDVEMTIETFYTPEETMEAMYKVMDDGFKERPTSEDTPESYLQLFRDWGEEEMDGYTDAVIELKIIEV